MRPFFRRILLPVVVAGLLASASPGRALEVDREALSRGWSRTIDGPLRLGGLVRLAVGAVVLVPATVLTTVPALVTGDVGLFRENVDLYVLDPFDYTFRRAWGEDLAG